jgi:membrane protein
MQSAVIAYYAIFSIPGLLIMAISIGSIFFNRDIISNNLFTQISSIMGTETARQIQEMVKTIGATHKSLFATIIGLVVVIVGATGVFVELQKALNVIWEVKVKKRKPVFHLIRTRLFSFGLIVSIGFLMLISLIITTILAAISDWVLNHWPNLVLIIFYSLNYLLAFIVTMLMFALMFKVLPDAKVLWKHIWPGSILTALLFLIGKASIGFYLSKTNPGSAYGPAGSIVLILLWVSYSSMIFFFGAEFTRAYADHITGRIQATDLAVKIV